MKQVRPFGLRIWWRYKHSEIDSFESWWRGNANAPWGAVDASQDVQIKVVHAVQPFGIGIKISGVGKTLTLRNAAIRRLEVHSVPKLCIEDCRIGEIVVHQTVDYQIKNSMIGNFVVDQNFHVQNLSWEGGYLGHFDLHQEKTKAFVSDVLFHRVTLPPTAERYRVQWLRDAREALTARSNLVAAGIFHASELRLSRSKAAGLTYWLASWGYQLGSNFGNSIARALGWLIFSFFAIVLVAYCSGTEPSQKASAGWFTALKACGMWPEVRRAGVYAAQSILNPLNLFVQEPLVSVSNGWGAFAGLVLGILGIASLALLLLSVRRRFKLE